MTRSGSRYFLIGLTLCAVAAATPGGAQTVFLPPGDTLKVSLIHQLLARTGAVDQALAAMEATITAQRAANPKIPPVFWDRFLAQARARRGELSDMIAAVYVSYFTADDLKQLLAFYDTPLGRKLLAAQPQILRQSIAAGQHWGAIVGMDVARQLHAEGVKVQP